MAVALAVLGLLALAGNASATSLTSPAGTAYTGSIKGESAFGHLYIHSSSGTFTCGSSKFEGKVESHGLAVTAKVTLSKFSFEECGETQVTVVKPGFFEIHPGTLGSPNDDVVTWSGVELTTLRQSVFGPIHCLYLIPFNIGYTFGTITSSTATGHTATLHRSENRIPKDSTSGFCSNSIAFTGIYEFTTPDYLDVD